MDTAGTRAFIQMRQNKIRIAPPLQLSLAVKTFLLILIDLCVLKLNFSAVQPKRHPIRKKRIVSEAQSSPEITDISNKEEVELNRKEQLTADYFAPVGRKDKSVLTEITNAYRLLEKSRAEKYSSINIPHVIDSKTVTIFLEFEHINS